MVMVCVVCNEEAKSYVQLGDKKIHGSCFKCATCQEELAGKPFLPYGDLFYCEKDYPDHKFCGHCEEALIGVGMIEALGKFWHEHHFLCSDCGCNFADDSFRKIEENPYCESCWVSRTCETCSECNSAITTATHFELDGKKFHPECYTCPGAGEEEKHVLAEDDKVSNYNGHVYCLKHLGVLLGVKCSACKQLLEGKYLQVGDRKLHQECWKCEHGGCQQVLNLSTIKGLQEKKELPGFYCDEHMGIAQGTFRNPASTSPKTDKPAAGTSAGSERAVACLPPGEATMVDNVPRVFYALDMLQGKKRADMPSGVDFGSREQYLDDKVFFELFGMDKAKFGKLPSWRRKQKKQQVNLF